MAFMRALFGDGVHQAEMNEIIFHDFPVEVL